jgi:hypothetical protein
MSRRLVDKDIEKAAVKALGKQRPGSTNTEPENQWDRELHLINLIWNGSSSNQGCIAWFAARIGVGGLTDQDDPEPASARKA